MPVFSSYEADVIQIEMDSDGMRIDLLEETLDRLEREGRRPKFIYTVPTFQNPAGVTLSAAAPGRRLVELAARRELLVLEDNPYGLLRYEGEPLPTALLARRRASTCSTWARSRRSSRRASGSAGSWRRAPVLAKVKMGKAATDLCTSSLTQQLVDAYFAEGRWLNYIQSLCAIYRQRRDAMLDALAEFFLPQAEWTQPGGGLFIWATLPDFIDTSDLLAKAIREENVAFVPGSAAYVDGRGASSMRLNFSGVDIDGIRRGHPPHRQGRDEQIDLYGTLHGRAAGRGAQAHPRAARRGAAGGRLCTCRAGHAGRRAGTHGRVAVLKGGRPSSGEVSLRSGNRVEDALEELGADVVASTSTRRSRGACGRRRPRSPSSRCTAGAARTAPFRRSSRSSGSPTRARESLACMRCMDKVLTKHKLIGTRAPDTRLLRVQRGRFQGVRGRRCAAGDRGAARLPARRQAGGSGLGVGDSFRRGPPSDVPEALVAAFSYDDRVLLERHVSGRELAVVRARGEWRRCRRCLSWKPCPREGYRLDFEARYEIGKTDYFCPADLPGDAAERAQELARADLRAARLRRLRPRRHDHGRRTE